jgi:hypothetical protein
MHVRAIWDLLTAPVYDLGLARFFARPAYREGTATDMVAAAQEHLREQGYKFGHQANMTGEVQCQPARVVRIAK